MFIAKSISYYPDNINSNSQELSDEIIIPSYELNRLMDRFDENESLYLKLINTDNNMETLVAIGAPHNFDKNTVFIPQWILDIIGCSTDNSIVKIKKADVEEIPVATKIVIRPLDPIAFDLDILNCFETALMNLHSIREGITVPIITPELGKDYVIFAHIEKVEPAPVSRIIESEVDVEFINEFSGEPSAQMVVPPSTAVAPVNERFEDDAQILPEIPQITSEETLIQKEERQKRVRESWLTRFQNISK